MKVRVCIYKYTVTYTDIHVTYTDIYTTHESALIYITEERMACESGKVVLFKSMSQLSDMNSATVGAVHKCQDEVEMLQQQHSDSTQHSVAATVSSSTQVLLERYLYIYIYVYIHIYICIYVMYVTCVCTDVCVYK